MQRNFESAHSGTSPRRDLYLILSFWIFSYALLSIWGALAAQSWTVVLSERRLIAVTAGAFLFWLALRRVRGAATVPLGSVILSIVAAGIGILAVRLGLDQFSPDPLPPGHSMRWSLAWSGYFGIWLLAVLPVGHAGRMPGDGASGPSATNDSIPSAYLEVLFERSEDQSGRG